MAGRPNNPMTLFGGPSFRVEFPDHTSELRRPREPSDDTIVTSFNATFTLLPLELYNQYHIPDGPVHCQRAFSAPLHRLIDRPGAQDIVERMLAAVHAPAVPSIVDRVIVAARFLWWETSSRRNNLAEWNPRIGFHLVFVVRELPNVPDQPRDEGDRVRHYAELYDELGFFPIEYAFGTDAFLDDDEDRPGLYVFDDDDDVSLGFEPASEESIEGLEKVVIKEVSEDYEASILSCTVCLEDISVGSEATRLPCSHYFHGNCIAKWLETSKSCPLCRSEMRSRSKLDSHV